MKNIEAKKYLSLTEDDIKTTTEITFSELRNTFWDKTSLTEDMRRMNTHRLMHEIREQIDYIAREIEGSPFDAPNMSGLRTRINYLLHQYMHRGAIRNYNIGDMEQEITPIGFPSVMTRMIIEIVPTGTLERVQMDICLLH